MYFCLTFTLKNQKAANTYRFVTVQTSWSIITLHNYLTHDSISPTPQLPQESGTPEKWRVENSWGEDRGEKGYLIMTSEWFKEFVFEIVVDKKYVPEEVLAVFSQEPIVLPAWDPMGALARDERPQQLQF